MRILQGSSKDPYSDLTKIFVRILEDPHGFFEDPSKTLKDPYSDFNEIFSRILEDPHGFFEDPSRSFQFQKYYRV